MSLVVLKFGGTSLANIKLMKNAIIRVIDEVSMGNKVVAVVSAMAGVTDHLIELVAQTTEEENLSNSLEYATVITTGEQVSAGLFALLLQQKGLKARSWLGWQVGIITDENVRDAEILDLRYKELEEFFAQNNQVAVVTGFQGVTKSGRVSTLGRGGSDTTAILLAGALKAERCDIYTDVEGVFTADPRIVSKAQKIKRINYDEMLAFASAGAKVLQAKSVKWAKQYQVNLQVLSSFTNNTGTFIDNSAFSFVAGIALSKYDKMIDNRMDYAKISVVGGNIQSDLKEYLKNELENNAIEVIEEGIDSCLIWFVVKDLDKFEAMKYLHMICQLDENK